jgi:hypothetical protein
MRRVVIESPYAGDIARNEEYARICMRDCLDRGEAPFASHLLYTQVYDDADVEQRNTGIAAGFAWGALADACVVYADLGISPGMQLGIDNATANGIAVEFRSLKHSFDLEYMKL